MSINASTLFFRPNCKGVNARFEMIFIIKGNTTIKDICFCASNINTFPKEIVMSIYSTDHTGPNNHPGGAHVGLINSVAY